MGGFGFTPNDPDDSDESKGSNPDFSDFGQMFQKFSGLGINLQGIMAALSGKSSPQSLSRELIREISRKFSAAHGELPVSIADSAAVHEAMNIADLWLNEATIFSSIAISDNCAISRRDWIDSTLTGWEELATPLVGGMTEALSQMLKENLGEESAQLPGGEFGFGMGGMNIPQPVLISIMGTFISSLISSQLGQTIGNLSMSVTGANDVALPLTAKIRPQLIPQNIVAWGSGLEIEEQEVRIYLALRELAAARLFAAAPWLRETIKGAISAYGKGIRIDISAVTEQAEEALASGKIDPTNPESMTFALTGGLFTPEETPAQRKALEHLENLLALIEGWIDVVVALAAENRLPSIVRLRETQQRRRATNSPTQQLFATLIGLEVSPRKSREAAKFWSQILELSNLKNRDEIWAESFLLPDSEQLADPEAFLRSRTIPDDLSGLI